MGNELYQHYRPEELPYVDQVLDWIYQVENNFLPLLTKFLTPREVMILQDCVNRHDEIYLALWGGYEGSERVRACIYPSYYEWNFDFFELAFLQINYPRKFIEMTHSQILGSILGTGLQRDRLGDIITDGETWQFILDQRMEMYIRDQFTKVGSVGIHLQSVQAQELIQSIDEWEEVQVVSPSLRLDALLSKIYQISRQRAKEAVQAGRVKVNFVETDRSDIVIGPQDIVSMRQAGRFRIKAVEGMTRKENYRLTVEVLKV